MLKKVGMFLGLLGLSLFLSMVFYRTLPSSAKTTPIMPIKDQMSLPSPILQPDITPITPIEESRWRWDPNYPAIAPIQPVASLYPYPPLI